MDPRDDLKSVRLARFAYDDLAAVAKNRVDFLRGGPQKFHLIRSTPMRVENAVGCAVCRTSDELLVVLKDGYLIKTRIYV